MRLGAVLRAAVCAVLLGMTGSAYAVTMDGDGRLTLADYAAKQGENPAQTERRFGATGIVTCGATHSTAQLTIRNDVITTAAHAFYDPRGRLRADIGTCVFSIAEGAKVQSVRIRPGSLRVGSVDPYAEPGVKDWAVARLSRPIEDATPYRVVSLSRPSSIFLVANRHEGWIHDGRKAIEACAIRAAVRRLAGAARELAIDCSTGQGASGSALMLPGAPGTMIGIYVGWRSSHPQAPGPFAPNHLNYGLAIEGPFRVAIEASAAPEPQIAQAAGVSASLARAD